MKKLKYNTNQTIDIKTNGIPFFQTYY